jgi:hypothetical protein
MGAENFSGRSGTLLQLTVIAQVSSSLGISRDQRQGEQP